MIRGDENNRFLKVFTPKLIFFTILGCLYTNRRLQKKLDALDIGNDVDERTVFFLYNNLYEVVEYRNSRTRLESIYRNVCFVLRTAKSFAHLSR